MSAASRFAVACCLVAAAGCGMNHTPAAADAGEQPKAAQKDDGISDAKSDAAYTTGPGVKVGDAAPEFELKNQDGKDVSLESLTDSLKEQGGYTALVFYRSADW